MTRIYRSCNDLSIYRFYKIVETGNLKYLFIDYDEYNDSDISDNISDDVELVWQNLYDQYLKLAGDSTTILYYEVVKELLYLETRYKIASSLLEQLSTCKMSNEILQLYAIELKKWRYNLDLKKPLGDEVVRLVRQLKGSENKIRIKKEEKKSFENKEEGEKMSLIQQQVKLEQALTRNEIDTRKTVVSKWIAMIKEVKAINQERKNKNGK